MTATKIATCCYCGTRAALKMTSSGRHELSCSSCGAPLHEMKMLRAEPSRDAKTVSYVAGVEAQKGRRSPPKKVRKKKKKKSLRQEFLSEVFDVLEDIFD